MRVAPVTKSTAGYWALTQIIVPVAKLAKFNNKYDFHDIKSFLLLFYILFGLNDVLFMKQRRHLK